ncbi:RNB domain-containing ribonuclease [Rhodococcus sp. SORGH_AS_0301]|uniref:RNB domain-containing ribonuclease n=1 Tax=Rhodococcus sp. SORGH_AS_0301 TaxID=3041780 RepID=UPI00277D4D73|nr:RNB domain-containing ribonuclease [Rhodococcus sp. SORGH_AS_0301]MDQ1179792.1 VacB/RNase II family 3'-5' exoribonuclease [Rhodococcus sp. SORGH_AS_0301]
MTASVSRRAVAPRVDGVDFSAVRAEFDLPTGYPPDAVPVADSRPTRRDATDLEFVTIDPPGSMDLDQALVVHRTDAGFRLYYAIADVGAVVAPGSVLDEEVRRRGQTLYLPDDSVPLHPRQMSEDASSLLPDRVRPAALWTIDTDPAGTATCWHVEPATVRSRQRFTYDEVQSAVDSGTVHPSLTALQDLGRARRALAVARGAIELALPEQEVVADGSDSGGWRLEIAPRTEADAWNAEMSLLTGMCAAAIMLEAKVGILRTLPPPGASDVEALRAVVRALGLQWPTGASPGQVLAGLDPAAPTTLAVMTEATTLLRGAAYVAFDGETPEEPDHSGIGGPYAHVTAPLRRRVDRYATEVCLAHCAGTAVPDWVLAEFAELPDAMRRSDSLASKVDRACIDLVEARVLADRVGDTVSAVVLRGRTDKRPAEVFVPEYTVVGPCSGDPAEGTTVTVRVGPVDVATRRVEFSVG